MIQSTENETRNSEGGKWCLILLFGFM
jgi:hypothetical protein